MSTVIRTSVHTCIVTREAVEFMIAQSEAGRVETTMMPTPSLDSLVAIKTLIPPSTIEDGHIRAVFELTERVDA